MKGSDEDVLVSRQILDEKIKLIEYMTSWKKIPNVVYWRNNSDNFVEFKWGTPVQLLSKLGEEKWMNYTE